MNNHFGEMLDTALMQHISTTLAKYKAGEPLPEPVDLIPDSFGALMERLAIEHVRVFHIEDAIGEAIKRGDKDAVFELKKKMDICWKCIKPRLVSAINRKLDDALAHGRSAVEESVKLYRGYDKQKSEEIDFLKLIEELAKAIHDGWMEEKRQLGFTRGPKDDAAKKHPHFCSWEELETKSQDRFWAATIVTSWAALDKPAITPYMMHEAWRKWPRLHGMIHPHDRPFDEAHADGAVEHEVQARLVNDILNRYSQPQITKEKL